MLSLLTLASIAAAQTESPTWGVFYYMAYDNNLEKAGPPILDMLQSGMRNDSVRVLVSADFRGGDGMKRFVLGPDGSRTETRIEEERSAHPDVLAAELAWASETVDADRWAVVFLDHGGRLPEMSNDEHTDGAPSWLYVPEVAEVLSSWADTLSGSVELVFLQQCGKGTVRNYEALQDVAPIVMASQTVVGAPNTYYGGALRTLSADPSLDGAGFVEAILDYESPLMYTTYTAVNTAHVGELWPRVEALLELRKPGKASKGMQTFGMKPAEGSLDLLALLEPRKKDTPEYVEGYEALSLWVKDELLLAHAVSPVRSGARVWSGLSVVTSVKPSHKLWPNRWEGYLGEWDQLPRP